MTEQDHQRITRQLETIVGGAMKVLREEMRAMIEASETRLLAELRDVETTLRDDFKKWSEPRRQRERSFDASLTSVRLDLEDAMDRLKKLEEGKAN